MLANRL